MKDITESLPVVSDLLNLEQIRLVVPREGLILSLLYVA